MPRKRRFAKETAEPLPTSRTRKCGPCSCSGKEKLICKANFDECKPFKAGMSDLSEFTTALFFELRKPKGGAQLEMRVHEENYLEHGLMPPKDILESAVHHFTARDADTDTLEAMLAAGELEGGDIAFARP